MSDVIESTVNAEPIENVVDSQEVENTATEQVETTQDVSSEVVDTQVDNKPVQSKEDNARFAEMRRKAEAEAKDKLISEMYGESHGIHTYAEYQEAVRQQQEQQKLQELMENNVPEDVAKELIESKKFREQYEAEKQTKAQEEAKRKDYESFLESYPDVKADEIPLEVWEENSKGKSLVDAYAKYENKLLKQQLAEFKKGQQAQQSNANNASSSTGSVTGQGAVPNGYYTHEQVKSMSQTEVTKNYGAILESMKHWNK